MGTKRATGEKHVGFAKAEAEPGRSGKATLKKALALPCKTSQSPTHVNYTMSGQAS